MLVPRTRDTTRRRPSPRRRRALSKSFFSRRHLPYPPVDPLSVGEPPLHSTLSERTSPADRVGGLSGPAEGHQQRLPPARRLDRSPTWELERSSVEEKTEKRRGLLWRVAEGLALGREGTAATGRALAAMSERHRGGAVAERRVREEAMLEESAGGAGEREAGA